MNPDLINISDTGLQLYIDVRLRMSDTNLFCYNYMKQKLIYFSKYLLWTLNYFYTHK